MKDRRSRIGHTFGWRLFLGALICSSYPASGQGLYNESDLYVDADLYVHGDIQNDGHLVNNGRIAFGGDWESAGSYKGTGLLEVDGAGPQKISHYNQKVHGVIINGWGSKYIKGKINITNEFRLTNGIVEVSSQDRLELDEGVVIYGGSAVSYVDGALAVNGTGYKFFPLGKNGTYAPIEFLDVKGNSAEYSVEAFENAPVVSVDDMIVRSAWYWQRKDLRGNFRRSPVAVAYDPLLFTDLEKVVLLAGTDWESAFMLVENVNRSGETNKLITGTDITAPIIMLGEISDRWTDADFYFSTALSPNASNPDNRKVKIFGKRLAPEQFHLAVFNRWGNLVYETRSLESILADGWDGHSIDGRELAAGSYPYRLSAVDKTGQRFEKKGVITIIY